MRELAGQGVEWGVDWVIRSLLRDNLTPANTEEAFEESVSQCYPETITVGWLELDTVSVLKEMDPVAWDLAESEWIDSELSDGNLTTFDKGSNYYWSHEIESTSTSRRTRARDAPVAKLGPPAFGRLRKRSDEIARELPDARGARARSVAAFTEKSIARAIEHLVAH
jgi:hypothetical protein